MEIIRNLPFEEYRKRPGANSSILKLVDSSSLKRVRAELNGEVEHDTDATDFGDCFHALLLEGRIKYTIEPETYPAPKDHEKVKKGAIKEGDPLPWNNGAGICKQWAGQQGELVILTKKEAENLEAMVAAVHDCAELQPYLKGDCELSVFAERQGFPVKARIDLLPPSGPVIDFKKTRNAEPGAFVRQMLDLRYHMQAAWNIDVLKAAGIERDEFWFVAVEDKAPFDVTILKLKDQAISFLRVGRVKCRQAFQKLKNAHAEDHWPTYGAHHAEDHAKPWMMQELELTA